jgi:ATP-dependent DNA ligase
LTRVYAISDSVDSEAQAIDQHDTSEYNRGMENTTKTIDLRVIDTFTLSQEDVMDLPLSERKAYALVLCAHQMAATYNVSYDAGMVIAKVLSLTYR